MRCRFCARVCLCVGSQFGSVRVATHRASGLVRAVKEIAAPDDDDPAAAGGDGEAPRGSSYVTSRLAEVSCVER